MSLQDATVTLRIVYACIYTLNNMYIEYMYFMCFYRILQYIDIIIYIMNTNSLDPITMYVYRIDDIYDKLHIHLVYV